jgi:hypothetical protein
MRAQPEHLWGTPRVQQQHNQAREEQRTAFIFPNTAEEMWSANELRLAAHGNLYSIRGNVVNINSFETTPQQLLQRQLDEAHIVKTLMPSLRAHASVSTTSVSAYLADGQVFV